MATKTVTIDTGEWIYLDASGSPHTVTDGQTFTFELTDNSETDVQYYIDQDQSITTTDGLVITFRPEVDQNNTARYIGSMADANDAALVHTPSGEIVCEDPTSGVVQRWTVASTTIDDVDTPTELTTLTLEDQFGNIMSLPSTGSGITVA